MTVPGVGPISATAIAALAPPAETFAKGRDFAAWLGLTPLHEAYLLCIFLLPLTIRFSDRDLELVVHLYDLDFLIA